MIQYQNIPQQRCLQYFRGRRHYSQYPNRMIYTNIQDINLSSNYISSTKYNIVTFLPKTIYYQFTQAANIFFLLIGILETIKYISLSNQQPTIYLPLTIIISLQLITQAYYDLKRYKYDVEMNSLPIQILTSSGWIYKQNNQMAVGNIVRIYQNQPVMADILLLKSSQNRVYVQTKNLDGQTNLKIKKSHPKLNYLLNYSDQELFQENLKIQYEKPNPNLHQFKGKIQLRNGQQIKVDINNFLQRGSTLKIVKSAIGIVLYNGYDTKIMINYIEVKKKTSHLQKKLNYYITVIFIILVIFTFFTALASSFLSRKSYYKLFGFQFFITLLIYWGIWILIYSYVIPISLIITFTIIKIFQAKFLQKDNNLYSNFSKCKPSVKTPNLNQNLGQIQYIMSDKTGTLTTNIMNFKFLYVEGKVYGQSKNLNKQQLRQRPAVSNVDFQDKMLFDVLKNKSKSYKKVNKALTFLSLCHTIIPEYNLDNEIVYNASSTDQLALVNFAKFTGYQFYSIDSFNKIQIRIQGIKKYYHLHHIFQFNSQRKRMSVIVENEQGKYFIFCKGADNIIQLRLKQTGIKELELAQQFIKRKSQLGYRILMLAQKQISLQHFQSWNSRYHKAISDLKYNQQQLISKLQNQIQMDLEFIGITAVQDKLQPNVKQTISLLKNAGIKIWILTGDKKQTAINVAYSCGLITTQMQKIVYDQKKYLLKMNNLNENPNPKLKKALIISGQYLAINNSQNKIINMALQCQSVIVYRMSPSQKAQITQIVKHKFITLSIGDGANDVNMLEKANVGVGISGKQGNHAVNNADYSIGQFSILADLILVQGRQFYRKNCSFIYYTVYKNVILALSVFWYAFFSGFTGSDLYNQWVLQFYNSIYTCVPIIIYSIFDIQYNRQQLLLNNLHYQIGLKNKCFNFRQSIKWLIYSILDSLMVTIIPLQFIELSFNSNKRLISSNEAGIAVLGCLTIVSNFQILIISKSYSLGQILIILVSIGSYFLFTQLFIEIQKNNEQIKQILNSYQFYASVIFFYQVMITSIICFFFVRIEDKNLKQNVMMKIKRQSSINHNFRISTFNQNKIKKNYL